MADDKHASPPASAGPDDPARRALSWAHSARFLTTASRLDQLPATELPEIAFVGRSNAGKSTAINTLTQQKRLAFASKTPGRTQHINLFALGPKDAPDAFFADLPGYGYAAVPKAVKQDWQRVLAAYVATRATLVGLVLVVDARHGLKPLDETLLDGFLPSGRPVLVLATKSDKLSRTESAGALAAIRKDLERRYGPVARAVRTIAFSATDRTGVPEADAVLADWLGVA